MSKRIFGVKWRIIVASLLGMITGLFCAYMATIRKPIPITPWVLLGTVYTRTLAGILIGMEMLPYSGIISGAIIGFFVSLAMGLPFGPSSIGFAIIGAVYGAVIGLLTPKIEKLFGK